MSYNYNIKQYIYNAQSGKAVFQSGEAREKIGYEELLKTVRKQITDNYSEELREAFRTDEGEKEMRAIIYRYVYSMHRRVDGHTDIDELVNTLYNSLFEFDILTKHIKDPNVQEINANRWDDIEVCFKNGYEKLTERFTDAIRAADVVKRMMALGGVTLDSSNPRGDAIIMPGVRAHAKIPPSIDDEDGMQLSIRKQRDEKYTSEEYVKLGSATKGELNFILLCLKHGVSVGVCGNTGAGKTSFMSHLCMRLPRDMRLYTIEDTRELLLDEVDESTGNHLRRVMATKTHYSDNEKNNVDMSMLVRDSLRCDPDIIIPSEIRGKEAMDVIEAGRTGHTILSSFHANNARDAYPRVVSMAMMANSRFSETMLAEFVYTAFPIMVFMMRMADHSRKIVEIVEAVQQPDRSYRMVPLYKFVPTSTEREVDKYGKPTGRVISITGKHKHVGDISDELSERLLLKGASVDVISKYNRNFKKSSLFKINEINTFED